MPKAVEVLDAAKFYRVDKATLTAALPRQMPQVDITKGGDKGMEIAVADMVHARLPQDAAADHRHHAAQASARLTPMARAPATLRQTSAVRLREPSGRDRVCLSGASASSRRSIPGRS